MTVASELSPFLTWFSNWGQVVYFFAQIVFWIFIAGAAVAIAMSYGRYVDHKTGAAKAKAEKKAADIAAKAASAAAAVPVPPAPAAPVALADPADPGVPAVEVDKFVD
jgi:hypothetical protein